MTLEEAINALTSMKDIYRTLFPLKKQDALSLGIEAMKFRKAEKEAGHLDEDDLLPGETKE